jgi:hypothetical protein
MMQSSTRAESADALREQAASCRRLAVKARTLGGSEALRTVAHQFDADAARIDPAVIDIMKDGDAAALVRIQLALERQTIQWLQPRSHS